MGDGKALQAGTSHNLGQHFATAYGIEFLDKDQQRAKPWSTSWGTLDAHDRRAHHDPRRRLGPDPAAARGALPGRDRAHPAAQGRLNEAVLPKAREVAGRAARGRACASTSTTATASQPGFKYADWEMRGVPLRLELGPKDIEKDQCVLVRRDTREKAFVPLAGLAVAGRGAARRDPGRPADARAAASWPTTRPVSRRYDEFKRVMTEKRGFLVAGWCRSADCEAKIKEETKATVRVIPDRRATAAAGSCVRCGQPSSSEVYFAQAY